MPDHLHLLTSVECNKPLNAVLFSFRRFTATRLSEILKTDGKQWAINRLANAEKGVELWEPDYRPKDASRGDIFDQKLDYIHENPVRAGYVSIPEAWKYSSAGFYYLKESGPVQVNVL